MLNRMSVDTEPSVEARPGRSLAVVARDEAVRTRVRASLSDRWTLVEATAGDVLPDALGHASIEAVIVDVNGPRRFDVVAEVRGAVATVPIVAVVHDVSQAGARAVLEGTVEAFVLVADLERALEPVVEAVHAGQLSLPRTVRASARRALSRREKQVLGMVVLGFSNGEIARQLYVTESTIKSHLSSAFAKLGVGSRNEAAALILDRDAGLGLGILSLSDTGA